MDATPVDILPRSSNLDSKNLVFTVNNLRYTPIEHVSNLGNFEVVKLLILAGADINRTFDLETISMSLEL